MWLSFLTFSRCIIRNMLFSSKLCFLTFIFLPCVCKKTLTWLIYHKRKRNFCFWEQTHDLPYLFGTPFSSKCNCLTNVFFCMSRGSSLRVRPRAGRRDGEPLGDCATSGRWVSQSIGRPKNRCRWYATCLGKFATAGRGGRGFSPWYGRGVAAATVKAHLRGELPPKVAIQKGELIPTCVILIRVNFFLCKFVNLFVSKFVIFQSNFIWRHNSLYAITISLSVPTFPSIVICHYQYCHVARLQLHFRPSKDVSITTRLSLLRHRVTARDKFAAIGERGR